MVKKTIEPAFYRGVRMKKLFYIKYVVDTGYEYLKDEAIVVATNESDAINNLKTAIGKLGNDYWVDNVISIEEFENSVFTKQYGLKPWF